MSQRLSAKLALKNVLSSTSSSSSSIETGNKKKKIPSPLTGDESSLQLSDALRDCKQLILESSNNGDDLRLYTASLYRSVLQHRSKLTQKEMDDAAFFHGLCAMDALLLFEENKRLQTELDWKVEALELVVLVDYSGSMSPSTTEQTLELQQVITQVCHVLEKAETTGIHARVYPFGDYQHESKVGFTLTEYKTRFSSTTSFNGSCTELNPAWDTAVSQTNDRPCVVLLISDGQFTGRYDIRNLHRFGSVRSLVFYAPTWSTPGVTRLHAHTLASAVSETATYNGDVQAPHVNQAIEIVLATCGSGKSVPVLPGRTLLGNISVPNLLLLPSGMAQVWSNVLSKVTFSDQQHHGQSLTFVRTLCQLFFELDSSARQNLERCMLSLQFSRLMSLVSPILKTLENFLGGDVGEEDVKTHQEESKEEKIIKMDEEETKGERKRENIKSNNGSKNDTDHKKEEDEEEKKDIIELDEESIVRREQTIVAVTKLYKLLIHFRNYVSSEKPKMLEKYVHDPKRMEQLQTIFLSATTVSERSQILEAHSNTKKWLRMGTLHLPSLETCGVGMPLFLDLFTKRLRTPFVSPETALLDNLLVSMFEKSAILPVSVDGEDDPNTVIPVYQNRTTKEIDLLAIIRLLPTHLVKEQIEYQKSNKEEPVLSEFTYQPLTAKRILYLLAVAHKQHARFPLWLTTCLVIPVLDPVLTKDTDDDNLSVYWMHILLQLAQKGRDDSLIIRLQERLLAWTIKFFVLRHLRGPAVSNHRISYEVPMYGSATLPFISDCPSELAYVVRTNSKGQIINHLTHAPYDDSDSKVITNPTEIARLYERNFEARGSLIRPTYLTNGRITLWSDAPTTISQAMSEQLQYLSRSGGDSKSISSSQSSSPFSTAMQIEAHMHTMADMGIFTAIPSDTKDDEVKRIIYGIINSGIKAKPIMEKCTYSVPSEVIIDRVVSAVPTSFVSGLIRSVFEIPNPPPKDWITDIDFMIGFARKTDSSTEGKDIKDEKKSPKEEKTSIVPKAAQSSLDDILELYVNQFMAAITCALTSPSLVTNDPSSSSLIVQQPLVKNSAGSKTYLLF